MIIRIKEGELTWLKEVQASDLPKSLPAGLRVYIRKHMVGLEPHGMAGAIPMRNGDTLQIIPKIGQVNFLRLLFRANGSQTGLQKEYDSFARYSLDDDRNIDLIVGRSLILAVAEILRRSPKCGRIVRHRRAWYAFGGVDALATALNLDCHQPEPVVSFASERTSDIPENRILTEAVLRVTKSTSNALNYQFEKIKNQWIRRFPRSDNLIADLAYVERGFASGLYGGARDYYRKALMLAKVTLGYQGISYDKDMSIEGDATLLNTYDIFEKYIRATISKAYSKKGFIVEKGGIGVVSLYTDGSFELVPDIFIGKSGKPIVIADAKYKTPNASDHYQMQSYLTAYRVQSGLLLSPRLDGSEVSIREFETPNKLIVREVRLPMNNLEATEKFLGNMLDRLAH